MGRFYDWTEEEKAAYKDVQAALAQAAELEIKKKEKSGEQHSLSLLNFFKWNKDRWKKLFGNFRDMSSSSRNGVIAGVVFFKTKSNNSGCSRSTMGTSAVAVAAFVSGTSASHLIQLWRLRWP